jgi:hypothetical protein
MMMIDVNNNIFLMDSSFIFSEIASFFLDNLERSSADLKRMNQNRLTK